MHNLNQFYDRLKKFHTSNNEGMDGVNRTCVMCSKNPSNVVKGRHRRVPKFLSKEITKSLSKTLGSTFSYKSY